MVLDVNHILNESSTPNSEFLQSKSTRKVLYKMISNIPEEMFNFARCELCEKKTSSIKYWFGSMICPKCYDLQRSNPQTILVSNLQD